jgi:hypothetical protein
MGRCLRNKAKKSKSLCLGPYITLYFLGFMFCAVGYSAKKIKVGARKKSLYGLLLCSLVWP